MRPTLRRLLAPAGLWYLAGTLEGLEVLRQRRRGVSRGVVSSAADRDPASVRLLTLTWWPAGAVALAAMTALPGLNAGPKQDRRCLVAGLAVTGAGIALRQWAIRSLGGYFTGHVLVQPGQAVVSDGPYRWVRHPSYTGMWLEMTGVGLSTGNVAGLAVCALLPLAGITARIRGEERVLTADLPGYREYSQPRARLVPGIW